MVDKLIILLRWIGFGSLLAISFRFFSFLVRLIENPYSQNAFEESHFFIDLFAAMAIMGLDKFFRERNQKANPNASLGALFFRHFAYLSVWIALLIILTGYVELWRTDGSFFLGFNRLRNDILIGWVLAAIYVVGVTGGLIRQRWRQSLIEVERYKKENLQVRLETLRAQINPHFLFNSLNTLSSLIHEDPDRASSFLRRISQVYRHVLEIRDRETVSLREEWQLMEAYKDLIETRFENRVIFTFDIPPYVLEKQLPPLCLQLLIENALKHNKVSLTTPLHIELLYLPDRKSMLVRNNYQPKETLEESTNVGLKNIQSRYAALATRPVQIEKTETSFSVELPML